FLRKFGGPSSDQSAGLYIDREDSIYLCGSFRKSARFGARVLTGSDFLSGFVAKLSNSGDPQFAYSQSMTNSYVSFTDLIVGSNLEISVIGYRESFEPPAAPQNGFAFVLNSDGSFRSSREFGSAQIPWKLSPAQDGSLLMASLVTDEGARIIGGAHADVAF